MSNLNLALTAYLNDIEASISAVPVEQRLFVGLILGLIILLGLYTSWTMDRRRP